MPIVRPATIDDFDRIFELGRQAFNIPASARERAREDFAPEHGRVAEDAGDIVATLRLLPFEQRWGGRSIPAAGIASVAVPPEQRGRGHATVLMHETLRELRETGTPVSTLFPATVPIYRACGYGYAGIRSQWRASLHSLPASARAQIEPFGNEQLDEVMACYASALAADNGLIDRGRDWWERRVLRSTWEEGEPYRYLVREGGRVTGYVIYRLERIAGDWRSEVRCRDLVWETEAAARALLALAAMHRSTSGRLLWAGPPTEPLADLLAEDLVELDFRFRWMLRLVDVPGAIEARGYPPHVEAATTIAVQDALLPENAGPWRIEVASGSAKVVPADSAAAHADAAAWASIWSGLHTPAQMIRLGALAASDEAARSLASMFAGPTPWLADFF